MFAMISRSRVDEFAIEGFRLIQEKTEERKKVRATFAFARIVARGSRAACPFFFSCLLASFDSRERAWEKNDRSSRTQTRSPHRANESENRSTGVVHNEHTDLNRALHNDS